MEGKHEYNVVDFSNGVVTNLISESAESIDAEFFNYRSESLDPHFATLFIKLVFDNEVRYYGYNGNILNSTITLSRNTDTNIELFDNKAHNPNAPYIFYDNNTFFSIGDDGKINVLSSFDKPVVSAHLADDGRLYILIGSNYFAEELGVIDTDGTYTALATDILNLNAAVITDVSDVGNVTFTSPVEVKFNSTAPIYVYDALKKEVILP